MKGPLSFLSEQRPDSASAFEFRNSAFVRPSGFGLRISWRPTIQSGAIILKLLPILLAIGALGIVAPRIAAFHMRVKSGAQDVSHATCFNCHLVSTNRLAWSKPRPQHDSPAGMAVSPDGSRLYIAIDDRDE